MLSAAERSKLLELRPKIEKALSYTDGLFTFEDVLRYLDEEKFQHLEFADAVLVFSINVYPQGRVLNVFLVAGTLPEIEVLESLLSEVAHIYNCKSIVATCRRGWLRSFVMERGWKESRLVTLEREA